MYVNAKIDVTDLEYVNLYEIIELFNNLDDNEQEEFFRKTGRISTKKRIKVLFEMLKNIKNFNIKMKYVKKAKKFNKVH
ncbi:hypothetical protein DPU56_05105 [Campylobacter jejuni]|nr:hypothetical protein [Campylobacter jejuni]EAL5148346.1 hypothetical protein [Campylobacter jejuni]ECQ8760422.1 hypothetical protein [Campylobacter jejuni]EHF1884734.1 hypothetical protein [Campylobacter jejuni]